MAVWGMLNVLAAVPDAVVVTIAIDLAIGATVETGAWPAAMSNCCPAVRLLNAKFTFANRAAGRPQPFAMTIDKAEATFGATVAEPAIAGLAITVLVNKVVQLVNAAVLT